MRDGIAFFFLSAKKIIQPITILYKVVSKQEGNIINR